MTGDVKILLGTVAMFGTWVLTNYDRVAAALASLCLAAWFIMQMYYKYKRENGKKVNDSGSETGE